jgi:hypothetical protein
MARNNLYFIVGVDMDEGVVTYYCNGREIGRSGFGNKRASGKVSVFLSLRGYRDCVEVC